ncbi:MAG: ABC transporter permease [Acholeplasmatales bacterium]|nr:MAG: ABC transporter permease [Acholeplasmatales bacterium]
MFSFQIGWRFLWRSKMQTLFITLGIGIGVAVLVFLGSLLEGLRISLIDTTIGSSAHITVESNQRNTLLEDDDAIMQSIRLLDNQITVVAKALDGPANIVTGASDSDAVRVRGFDFEDAEGIYKFSERLIEGRLPVSTDEAILGVDLVEALNLRVGDAFVVFEPVSRREVTRTLTGVYDFRVMQINMTWLVMTLAGAQTLLDVEGISRYEMQVNDVFAADVVAERLAAELGEGYLVSEWKSANQELLSGLEGQAISGIMIQVFVLISVVLGIASVLAITVMQKSRQLGILKAMGITDAAASKIFLSGGLILGLFGAILGVSLGLGLSVAFMTFALNPDGTPILELALTPSFIAISAVIAVLASLLAALVPARRSAKLNVIEVIRNG